MHSTVYVICGSPVRRRSLAGALRAGRDPPEVRPLAGLPSPLEGDQNSVLVIDLRGHVETPEPPWSGKPRIATGVVLIATTQQPVPAAWLEVARDPNVQLLLTPSAEVIDEARLRGAVAQVFAGNLGRVVAGVRRRCGQPFGALEEVIRAVVADPWGIRRPRDLARALRISPALLRTLCEPVALCRIDYVLTFIRLCAYEFLTAECHMTPSAALEAVGVRDRSNFRRQVRRARAGWRHASWTVPTPATPRRPPPPTPSACRSG